MAEGAAVTCETREMRETTIALYVEGDLDPAEVVELEGHLAACAECRAFADELRMSQDTLKGLADVELDAAALVEVRSRVRESLDRPRRGVPVWTALAAAAVIAIAALLVIRRPLSVAPESATADTRPTEIPTATAVASLTPAIAPVVPPMPEPATKPASPRTAARRSTPARRPSVSVVPSQAPDEETAVVKLQTSDPDVVIYWVNDSNGGQS